MAAETEAPVGLDSRLATLVRHGEELQAEGLPFPTSQVRETAEALVAGGHIDQALSVVKRGEALYLVASRDWTWIKPTLERADELRELAGSIGLDVTHLESRVGNPRAQFVKATLSQASLSRAAASASLAVAVLSDAIPKYCVQEAQRLGELIRRARNRGEDVTPAVGRFSQLLAAIQDEHTVQMARALVDVRHAVARIPRAPSVPPGPSEEEEEILMEARNLARRLQRIKSKARNAQSAARLMTQVRAALSEDRRFGTPEEEIEALWSEVDRLTRERQAAGVTTAAAADGGDEPDGAAPVGADGPEPPAADAPEADAVGEPDEDADATAETEGADEDPAPAGPLPDADPEPPHVVPAPAPRPRSGNRPEGQP